MKSLADNFSNLTQVMKLLAIAFFIAGLFQSCNSGTAPPREENVAARQDTLFRQNAPRVLAEIKRMTEADQAVRNLYQYNTADERIVDSLSKLNMEAELRGESGGWFISPDDPLYKVRISPRGRRFKDSLWREMEAMNTKHTARVVELMLRYGYPTSHRLDSTTNIDPFILLHHPDPKFSSIILPLLAREKSLGRVQHNSYELIRWTLNGRKLLPSLAGMKVDSTGKSTVTITLQ